MMSPSHVLDEFFLPQHAPFVAANTLRGVVTSLELEVGVREHPLTLLLLPLRLAFPQVGEGLLAHPEGVVPLARRDPCIPVAE